MKVLNIAAAVQRRPSNRAGDRRRSEPAVVIEFPARRTCRGRTLVTLSDNGWQDWPADVSGPTDPTF
jgi:hypothetical protein